MITNNPKGHTVTALVRNPDSLTTKNGLSVAKGTWLPSSILQRRL